MPYIRKLITGNAKHFALYSKEMTPEELRDFIESMPEGTVVSIEIKVVLEDG